MLQGKKVVLGITGSIAAYKIPLLVRLLIKEGAEVKVIMTPNATDFVSPLTLSTLSKNPVVYESFHKQSGSWNNHVELGLWADLMLFAPVTANTLSKMAHGQADNFLLTTFLSARCPVFIAPAMDMDMYNHPTTRRNIEILKEFGNHFIEPQTGELASGLSGPGRLEEPANILSIVTSFMSSKQDLKNTRILITAGPTYEKLDAVRYIGNFSSGKMGFELAKAAASRGARVILVTGPTSLICMHENIKRFDVLSASEMNAACNRFSSDSDIIIMAAAVADYTFSQPTKSKLKKNEGNIIIELSPTKDILKELGDKKHKQQVLVGFALETDNEITNAENKLKSKNLDLIVLNSLNDSGAGFGKETNKVSIISDNGNIISGQLKSKLEVANDILNEAFLRYLIKKG
ncbi:MAG: bifunctional phosphopantothenoylcysteine decarboxylase/phosphopantothenate--cysteine ligase CoaBC [Bacteroidota bacterium]